jgi:gliding motility-associatede transport system auxiliary component
MTINRNELIKTAGYIGAALLVGGYLRYSVQETMGTLTAAVLIAGGVLLAAAVAFNFGTIRTYSRRRSARLGANTAVMTLAVVAILGFFNFLGYRHHKRFDLTSEKLYSLSDQTRKIVSGLQKDVEIIKFDKTDDQQLRDLMDEYRSLSKRITFERIDPDAKIEIAKQHKVTRFGELVVTSGTRTERPQEGSEQALTNAILKVTRDALKTVCFIEGHGEKQLSSSDAEGYDSIERMLKNENYETRKINLVSTNQVPADCSVLVLAGPKQSLFPQEAAMIGKYLDAGGKALLLLDPDTDPKMGEVLKSWNIELGNDTVIDVSGVGRLFGTGPAVPLATTYGSHPITKDLEGTMTFFPLTRSVSAGSASSGDISTTDLLKTSADSWAETELKGNEVKFDEGKDKKGPITIGLADSKTMGDKEARLVVIGDSDFAANNYVGMQRNGDLFMNAINWLAQDEDLISIRPKSPSDRRVTMTASQQNLLFWVTVALMPAAVIVSGVYIWWKRR